MCKLFALTNLSKVTLDYKFLNAIKTVVCCGQQDGFGYSVVDKQDNFFGEKLIDPNKFKRLEYKHRTDKIKFWVQELTTSWGNFKPKNNKMMIAHGRTATNAKTIDATHPFNLNGHSFIHNGIIYPDKDHKYPVKSNNDSEFLFHYYLDKGTDEVFKNISGYYAYMDLTPSKLTIVVDDRATLYTAYLPSIDSLIFATTYDMIESFCKMTELKYSTIYQVDENTSVEFNGNAMLDNKDHVKKEVTQVIDTTKCCSYLQEDDPAGGVPLNQLGVDEDETYLREQKVLGFEDDKAYEDYWDKRERYDWDSRYYKKIAK